MDHWKNIAIEQAEGLGVCDEFRGLLRSCKSKPDMIALYKRGVKWALEHGCPSMDYLLEQKEALEKEGVFVGKEFHGEVLNDFQTYIFHNCKGEISVGLNIEKKLIPMLYFANGCEMTVKGIDGASAVRVPVYIFGENRISTELSDSLHCINHLYRVK